MELIITSISLFGYCLALRRVTNWPMEAMPFFVISVAVVCMYTFAYLTILSIGSIGFITLGGFFSILFLSNIFKNPSKFIQDNLPPGILVYIFFSLLFALFSPYAVIVGSDDYGRWLPFVKMLYFKQRLLIPADGLGNLDYPPAGALLAYLFLKLSSYTETNVYIAQQFFILSPLVILLRKLTWKNATFLYVSLITIIFFIFHVPLGSTVTLMMDNPTALFFGGLTASYYLMSDKRNIWLYLIFPATAMVLFRPATYPFVLVAGSIIILDQLFLLHMQHKNKLNILLWGGIFLVPFLLLKTWEWHYRKLGLTGDYSPSNLFSSIYNGTSLLNTTEIYAVTNSFIEIVKHDLIISLIFLTAITFLIRYSKERVLRARIGLLQVMLCIGFVAYASMVLLFFIYIFPPLPAIVINPSFQRFLSTYMLGWFVVAAACVVLISGTFKNESFVLFFKNASKLKASVTVFLLGILCFRMINIIDREHAYYKKQSGYQYVYNIASKKIAGKIKKITENKTLALLSDEDTQVLTRSITYELMPTQIKAFLLNVDSISVFMKHVAEFDYVLLIKTNKHSPNLLANHFMVSDSLPLIDQMICTTEDFNLYKRKNCSPHQLPVFLYEVVKENGRIRLKNL